METILDLAQAAGRVVLAFAVLIGSMTAISSAVKETKRPTPSHRSVIVP